MLRDSHSVQPGKASENWLNQELVIATLATSVISLFVLWPLLFYLSNDDINYIRDPEHLTKVYINSGRYIAGLTSFLIQELRTEIVQLGLFLRVIAVGITAYFVLYLVQTLLPKIDPLCAVFAASITLVYPYSLDLFSFSITANILIVQFSLSIAHLYFLQKHRLKFSLPAALIVWIGLLNYQLMMMFAIIVSLVVGLRLSNSLNSYIRFLLLRAGEVLFAFLLYFISRYLVEKIGPSVFDYNISVIKTISLVSDPSEILDRFIKFASKLTDVFLFGNKFFSSGSLVVFWGSIVTGLFLAFRSQNSFWDELPRWKKLILPFVIVCLVVAAANPYSVITKVGIFNNRQWGHGGLVFALFVACSIGLLVNRPNLQHVLAFACFFAIASNSATIAYEAKRTAETESHVANRIIFELESLEDFNPRRTPVAVIGQLSLWFFDRHRRSFGGGLSPRITKAAYSSLSEVAGYELRRPKANVSREVAALCKDLESETILGIYYKIFKHKNTAAICFFNPRNQPR